MIIDLYSTCWIIKSILYDSCGYTDVCPGVRDVLGDDCPCADEALRADGNIVDDRCSCAYQGVRPDTDRAAEMRAHGNVDNILSDRSKIHMT